VKVEAIKPPSIHGSAEPLSLVLAKQTTIFGLMEPSHLREPGLPSQYKGTVAEKWLQIVLSQNNGFQWLSAGYDRFAWLVQRDESFNSVR
jgi:hypothetical protein